MKIQRIESFSCFLLFLVLLFWGKEGSAQQPIVSKSTVPERVNVVDSIDDKGVDSLANTLSVDSVVTGKTPSTSKTIVPTPKRLHFWQEPYPNSTMALLCSIIPGGGQVYNKRYWKVPIVWGALAGAAYVIGFNQRSYNEYHTAYVDLKSSDPMSKDSWKAFVPYGRDPEEYFKSGTLETLLERGSKTYKSNRDLSVLAGVILYLLSALDAYVDAELYYFDASPNLTIQVGPTVSPPSSFAPMGAGVGCSISF